MKRILWLGCMALGIWLALSSTNVLAIRRAGGQGWGAKTLYGSLFKPGTLDSIQGQVLSVTPFTPLRQMGVGLLVMVQTKSEVIAVHLGPGWYIEEQKFEVKAGDQVMVRGSRIIFDEKPAIIATEVLKGDKLLLLRKANGWPVWADDEDD